MNSQPPGASSPMTTRITLAQWVATFLRWYPLRHGVVVGASQQALEQLNAAPQALTVFKAHAPNAKASTHAVNSFDWLIAAQNGPATLYQASLPSESGLLPPPSLKACWPGIQCVGQHELQARTLDAALQAALQTAQTQGAPNWLWVGSVPAAPVLAGATQLLQQAEVLAVRVTLHPEAAAHAGLETVQALLAAQGLLLCGIEPERNPQLGTALFVRDHASAHAQTRQQLSASGQAQAQLQAKLQAESQALQAEVQAKNQAIAQRDALTKDKADLQVKLQAESQALQAEAQAKKQAVAHSDALTKDKVDLQAKLQAETQARQAEAAAKADMAQQRDELTQAQAQLQAKLDAESQALQAEVKAKTQAITKAEALTKDNAELQNKLQAEAKARQAEADGKAAMAQQRDELTKVQAELKANLVVLQTQIKQLEVGIEKHQSLFQCQLSIGEEQQLPLNFNTKSDAVFTNKKDQLKYELLANTPAYLVSSEAGDFERAPKKNLINLQPNKAYELSGAIKHEGTTSPVIWFFEYDDKQQKIKSHNFLTQKGELRALVKTHPNAAAFAIGIRLGGQGSIDLAHTHFKFENTLAIEVAEALQQDTGSIDKKFIEVQATLQKQQQTQTQNSLRQIESFLRLQNYCGDRLVLPDMHGWPVSPDLGVHLIRMVETGQYDAVVEFGSGVSTMLIALAIQKSASTGASITTTCLSFEHLETYLATTTQQLKQAQLLSWVQLVHAPLVETQGAHNALTQYYDCGPTLQQLKQSLNKHNPKLLVFVDGPPAATGPFARYPALQAVDSAFEGKAEVHYLMDDYIRQDERDIVALWEASLGQQNRTVQKQVFNQFEKQACLLSVTPLKSQ